LKNGLEIVLHDFGQPFDPSKVPVPNAQVRLKDLKDRGAGLFLMQKMMDEVRFEFNQAEGNTLTMVKYRENLRGSRKKTGKEKG
jgi:serine/threonine-protein kinase RsbW